MLAQGHRLRIFTCVQIINVPDGIKIADANDIVPGDEILKYSKRNFKHKKMASCIFCYRMLLQGCGIWVDLDMLLLKPIQRANLRPGISQQYQHGRPLSPQNHEELTSLLTFTNTAFPMPPFYIAHEVGPVAG